MNEAEDIAKLAISLIDLTNLNDDCTPQDIDQLCADAQTPVGPVAAVCVWPSFVAQSKRLLAGTDVSVATVVNFPAGDTNVRATMRETKDCVANGADEVDLVMPYKAFADGDTDIAHSMIRTIRATTDGSALLKVILETGELAQPEKIKTASALALEEGADFI
ncbi:MAG: deoxyribose-phosphate aldolase, partial [Pseudomonadota bacterium]